MRLCHVVSNYGSWWPPQPQRDESSCLFIWAILFPPILRHLEKDHTECFTNVGSELIGEGRDTLDFFIKADYFRNNDWS